MKTNKNQIPISPRKSSKALKYSELDNLSLKNGTIPGQFFPLHDTELEFCKEKKMFFVKSNACAYRDYMPAKLSKGASDSYIYFYCTDPASGKRKRIRMKINHIPAKARKAAARAIIADINGRLALGWNPLISAASPKSYERLSDAMDAFLKIKGKETEDNTMRSYRSYVKIFQKWLHDAGIRDDAYACAIDRTVALSFMNGVDERETISPRTYNNYLKFYQVLFNWLKGKGYIQENPFDGIPVKPKKLTKKNRRSATKEELERLVSFLQTNNPEYLAAVLLCYACFLRPKEIVLLKCSDIDLERQVIHIRGEIAKNDNDSCRTIPNDIMPAIRALDLSHPDWFVFAKHPKYDFRPGTVKACSRKLAKYWSEHVRRECGFPEELQFYSLKDTGITEMISKGIPINHVQHQADHSSVAVTSIYVSKAEGPDGKIKAVKMLD